MSIACGADPFFVGSDILDIGSRKSELRASRNRMTPMELAFGIPTQMMVPNVPNVRLFPMFYSTYDWFASLLESYTLRTHCVITLFTLNCSKQTACCLLPLQLCFSKWK